MDEAIQELMEALQGGACEENAARLFQAFGKVLAAQRAETAERHAELVGGLREINATLDQIRNEMPAR